jgi:hypothetical protein
VAIIENLLILYSGILIIKANKRQDPAMFDAIRAND